MPDYTDLSHMAVDLEKSKAELKGLSLVLDKLFKNANTYTDYLEDELEDNPSAERYLDLLRSDLNQMGKVVKQLSENYSNNESELEKINLNTVLQAFFNRSRKLRECEDQNLVDDSEERLIRANMDQLSTVMMYINSLMSKDLSYSLSVNKITSDSGTDDYAINFYTGQLDADSFLPLSYDSDIFKNSDQLESLFTLGCMNSLKGEILCSSENGSHSFRLILPSMDYAAVAGQLDEGLHSQDLQGTETILVVDDEDMIWDVLIESLQDLGYIVLLAENGRDAVDIYRDNPGQIDLVILDMVMPEMNGREAFHELKKLDDEVKVLISSGFMAENEAGDLMEAGAAAFLRKPYRMVDLAKKLRQLLT